MGRLGVAFRVFFKVLFDAAFAADVQTILLGKPLPTPQAPAEKAPAPKPVEPPPPKQNPAVTLLAALQREARLIDFLKEDVSPYSDEQIGAAVREIHRDAAKTLDRMFGVQGIVAEDEGASVDIPSGFDAGRFRLTGKVEGTGPFRGTLQHHGWEVTRCELPTFTGSESAARTIAPAEIEIS